MNKFGLIGYPLGHSFSKNFFNQKFQSENINAEYVNFEIPTIDELTNILLSNPDLCGLNVTMPTSIERLKRNTKGICRRLKSLKFLPSNRIWKRTKTRLTAKFIAPKEKSVTLESTKGKVEIGLIPRPACATAAMETPAIAIPVNKYVNRRNNTALSPYLPTLCQKAKILERYFPSRILAKAKTT